MPGVISAVVEEQGDLINNLEKLANFDQVATRYMGEGMALVVQIGAKKLIADMTAAAEINKSAMSGQIGGDFEPLAPVNPTSPKRFIRGASEVHGPMDVIGIVGDRSGKYLRLTEGGRSAGKHPPAKALQDWAEKTLGVTPAPVRMTRKGRAIRDVSVGRALSKAIAAKGIRPTPMLEKSASAIQGRVDQIFNEKLLKIAAELGYK